MLMINMIDIIVDDDVNLLVSQQNIESAVKVSCLEARNIRQPSVCIRFSSDEVVQQLNAQWREKDKVTDVLSFPMQDGASFDADESLGDIILAVPFVQSEAMRLNLSVEAHSMHLIAHAILHLLGYDHIADDEAQVMQRLENQVMLKLGLHQPYPEYSDEVN
ncbi:rRNA maturation RNase YbeY [Ghiorsea bivora]|uniref:rRNA maturation RNase YbeY n=1 Tax=Ghiorsea bivora TaxID=1485545 RepID=UPI001E4E8ADF|nr:rRNA maturation RNase YbeY [Ghiorsea bivora]